MVEHNPFMFETTNQHPAIGIFMVGNPHRVGIIHHLWVPISALTGLWILFLFLGRDLTSKISHAIRKAMAPRSSFTL